jgi:hypothetical protein
LSGISITTIGRLERQQSAFCHVRTRTRLADALGAHPAAITRDRAPERAEP